MAAPIGLKGKQVERKRGCGRKKRYNLHDDLGSQLWVLASLHTMRDFQISMADAKKVFSHTSRTPTKLQSFVTNGNVALKDRGPAWLCLGFRTDPESDEGEVVFRVRRGHTLPTFSQWCQITGTSESDWRGILLEYGFWHDPETDRFCDEGSATVDHGEPGFNLEEAIESTESGRTGQMEQIIATQQVFDRWDYAMDQVRELTPQTIKQVKKEGLMWLCRSLDLKANGAKADLVAALLAYKTELQ